MNNLNGINPGSITTTNNQQKSSGPTLFSFGQNSQNLNGYSVGQPNDRASGGLRLRGGAGSNKQRSHSSSNQAGLNQSNIVFPTNNEIPASKTF